MKNNNAITEAHPQRKLLRPAPMLSGLLFALLLPWPKTGLFAQFDRSHDAYLEFYADSTEPGSKLVRAWYYYTVEKLPNKRFVLKIYNPDLGHRTHFITYNSAALTKKNGATIEWYDNGGKAFEGQYENDLAVGKWRFFDPETQKPTWSGEYHAGNAVGEWVELDTAGKTVTRVNITDTGSVGHFWYFDAEGSVQDSGTFVPDKRVPSILGPRFPIPSRFENEAVQLLTLPGCEALLGAERDLCTERKYLEKVYSQIKYPTSAVENGVEGTVFLRANVSKDGRINEIVVLRGVSTPILSECIRVLKSIGAWVPTQQSGSLMQTSVALEIIFRLE